MVTSIRMESNSFEDEQQMDDPESQDVTKSQTETLPAQSEPSSVSTAGLLSSQPASTIAKEKDGSVISAVTDPASVEGPLLPAMEEEDDGSGGDLIDVPVDPDVPEHVILDERTDSLMDSPNATPSDSPAVPTRKIPPPPETEPPEEQKVVNGENETPTKDADSERQRNIEKEHDFSQSPAVSSEIVERSPGGRYVRFLEKLGSGASKDVYKAYDTEEGIEVAWNVVSLAGVPKTERNRLVNEVRLLERLHHQNIISFHGSWVNREKQEVIFVTEILSSGTLKKFINKVQVIRWKIAKRWAVQILKGLEYLHSQEPPVIHRDLKCENIFINGPSGDLRIGDLGLSTVHQNGKMLSVLGTPEFMAPDMYDDKPYDKKVDVYAFGMCLLEIFTQEIPYSECNNPAQIYKKVSNGEPPEVLSRLQSKHARDFVNLCLGYKDEEGNFVRPTVSELLKHPFLLKRENDDDEVVVEKPLRERTIPEVVEGSATPKLKRKVKQEPDRPKNSDGSSEMPRKRSPSVASSDDNNEEADKFEEMPQSETNMRKVKVMMGRNEELKEDDGGENSAEKSVSAETEAATSSSSPSSPQNYLVAAAVIENENPNVLQFADGVLKLVITLPVKGENLNVQFDFHLVDDNPFQVAKEMVQELKIPETAIIEISETISRLAQQARIQLRAQQGGPAAGNVQHHSIVPGQHDQQSQFHHQQTSQGPRFVQGPGGNQSLPQQHDPNGMQQNQQGHYRGVVHNDVVNPDQIFQQGVAPSVQHPGLYPTNGSGSAQGASHSVQSMNPANPLPGSSVQQSQHFQHQGAQPSSFQVHGNAQFAHHTQSLSGDQTSASSSFAQQQGGGGTFPGALHQMGSDPSQMNQSIVHQDNFQHHPHANAPPHQLPVQIRTVNSASPVPTNGQNFHQPNIGSATMPVHDNRQTVDGQNNFPQPSHHQLGQSTGVAPQRPLPPPPPSSIAAQTQTPSASSLPPPAPVRPESGVRRQSESNETLVPSDLAPLSPKTAGHGESSATLSLQGASPDSSIVDASGGTIDSEDDDEDEDVKEELRKLEEDFQKNIQRAKKVYDNRMDNLQRSQYEKEAQHQKTLEKHQKERAEYEKRLAEEEKQQNRRIEQLQKELNKRKQTVAKLKRKQRNGFHGSTDVATDTSFPLPHETELSHVRSLSSSSTNPPSSPAASAHKAPPESNAGGGPPPAER